MIYTLKYMEIDKLLTTLLSNKKTYKILCLFKLFL